MKIVHCVIFTTLLTGFTTSQLRAAVPLINDFEDGMLPNNFSGGNVDTTITGLDNEVLQHIGNNPQQITATFDPPVTDNTTPFAVGFDFGISVEDGNGNYGIRAFVENQNDGVFSLVWKNDVNGGALTIFHGNPAGGADIALNLGGSDPTWNIASNLSDVEMYTYSLHLEVFPEVNSNGNAFNGDFIATVKRSDGAILTTNAVPWAGENIPAGNFDEIRFFNSSSRTTLEIDNFGVASIPEPSCLFFCAFGFLPIILRRKRS